MWIFGILSVMLMTCGVACRWVAAYVPSPQDPPGRADAFLNDGVSYDGRQGEEAGAFDAVCDEAGLDRSGSVDGARDGWLGSEELPVTADTGPGTSDFGPVSADSKPVMSADLGAEADAKVVTPFGEAAFLAALKAKKVDCVKVDGTRDGTTQALLDTDLLKFVDWSTVSGSVPAGPTTSWIGSASAVLLIWDLNACDDEDPINHDGNWADAGIVIRGAKVVGTRLYLLPKTGLRDMDFVDVTSTGAWQGEMYGVDDAALPPNLVEPVNGVKTLILQMAGLP
ncbi:MAG: hypothetical protein KAI47_27775 [Deltaproteobacteria bacterium]|nr:hypothetical protein [Deltaproteobacteria bacterium]